MLRVKKPRELSRGILGYIRSHLWVSIMAASYAFPALSRFEMPTGWFVKLSLYLTFRHIGISLLLLLIFAVSYLLLLKQPVLVIFVPGAANVFLSKLIDPILDQHMPKKEG